MIFLRAILLLIHKTRRYQHLQKVDVDAHQYGLWCLNN